MRRAVVAAGKASTSERLLFPETAAFQYKECATVIRDDIEAMLRSKIQAGSPVAAVIQFDLGADGMIVLDGKAAPPGVA